MVAGRGPGVDPPGPSMVRPRNSPGAAATVAISAGTCHIRCMGDDFDDRVRREIDRVLEMCKAEAERRGIDTRGKSLEEIRKLLAELSEASQS